MVEKKTDKRSVLSLLKNSKSEDIIIGTKSAPNQINEEIQQVPSKKVAMKRKNDAHNKSLCSLTIDANVHKLLKLHSSFTSIPMNQTIEELLIKFLKNNKTFKEELKKFMEE